MEKAGWEGTPRKGNISSGRCARTVKSHQISQRGGVVFKIILETLLLRDLKDSFPPEYRRNDAPSAGALLRMRGGDPGNYRRAVNAEVRRSYSSWKRRVFECEFSRGSREGRECRRTGKAARVECGRESVRRASDPARSSKLRRVGLNLGSGLKVSGSVFPEQREFTGMTLDQLPVRKGATLGTTLQDGRV